MMERLDRQPPKMELINLNEFVPKNHFIRKFGKFDGKIVFPFIYGKMEPYYSPNGRKSIDPVPLFKMLLIGYLYNIPSERELEEQRSEDKRL